MLDGVNYDIQALTKAYAKVSKRIKRAVCNIFSIMVVCSIQRTVLSCKPFEYFGWLPRTKHAKLLAYTNLINNLLSLAQTFDLSVCRNTLDIETRTALAYSFHAPYFDGLAEAYEQDLLDVQVACAGMFSARDVEHVAPSTRLAFDAISHNNVAWFLKAAKKPVFRDLST
jgi:hypothetical protein